VDASWNDAGIVLVLLDTAQEGDLLFFVVLWVSLLSYDVAPITAEHSVRLPAAGLAIGEKGNVKALHRPQEQRLHDWKHLPLGGICW
jgi:hypothetical protein